MSETFQIPIDAAQVYEERFVPAIFAEWAPRTLAAARVGPSTRLLDVACGTGIVARTARNVISEAGRIVGVDLNPSMLQVARTVAPDVDWRPADVVDLPFDDETFDAATCQMAMMFFPDRPAAMREMRRVLAPAGRLVLVVPASLDQQPGYRVFVDAVARHAGASARSLLGAYWSCGDLDVLTGDLAAAACTVTDVATVEGTARFESVDDFVATEIAGSPLAERIDSATAEQIVTDVRRDLGHGGPSNVFTVPFVGHVVTATR